MPVFHTGNRCCVHHHGLRNGYVLPFYTEPTPYVRPNQNSAQIEVEFVTNAVAELLKGGYIEEVKELPVVCMQPIICVHQWNGQKTACTLQIKKCEGHLSSPAVRLKSIDGHKIFYHWGEITPTRERLYWCEVIHSAIRVTFTPLFV